MLRIFSGLVAICLLTCTTAFAQLNLLTESEVEGPAISFEQTEFQLGDFEEGELVEFTFHFTSSGSEELVVEHVKPSCACSTLEWTEDPVAPGESGEIRAAIDTKGKSGEQTKYFTVIYNGNPGVERLKVHFNILPVQDEEPDEVQGVPGE